MGYILPKILIGSSNHERVIATPSELSTWLWQRRWAWERVQMEPPRVDPPQTFSLSEVIHMWMFPLQTSSLCTIAEVSSDPEVFPCNKKIHLWRGECRGGRHPWAHRQSGDDSGLPEAGSQDHDKGKFNTPRPAQLAFASVTAYKCTLERLQTAEGNVATLWSWSCQSIWEDLIKG